MRQLIGWTGANNLESNKNKGFFGMVKLLVVTFFMTLMLLGGIIMLFQDIGVRAISVTGIQGWANDFWMFGGYIFFIIAIRLYVNWFFIFKQFFIKN